MDLTHLHLILNHLPVMGIMFGFLILVWGILRKAEEVKTVGLIFLVVTAFAALPVYLTGEPAEEAVENLPGVSEQIIELHENSALLSLILAMVTGVLAFVGLLVKRFLSASVARVFAFAVLFLSFVTGAFMARTANLGGEIRHTEIRQTAQNTNPAAETKQKTEEDDDN